MMKIPTELERQMKAVQKRLEPIQAVLQQHSASFEAYAKKLTEAQIRIPAVKKVDWPELRRQLDRWSAETKNAMKLVETFERQLPKVEPLFPWIEKIDWAKLQRELDTWPAKSKSAMTLALRKGWFFGLNGSLREVMGKVDQIANLPPDELDAFMAQHFRDSLNHLAAVLTKCYPDRAQVIEAATQAHSEGLYALSVPVFIAQADGIFSEVTGVMSALQRDRGANLSRGATALDGLIKSKDSRDLLHPIFILHTLDFMKSKDSRDKTARTTGTAFNGLNRHQVMHGEVSDYGNELNSLRAFSFLCFVGVHLPETLLH